MARVGLGAAGVPGPVMLPSVDPDAGRFSAPRLSMLRAVDMAVLEAAQFVVAGAHSNAADLVADALGNAGPGNAGWLIPIEPMLQVAAHPDIWARALAHLRNRAS